MEDLPMNNLFKMSFILIRGAFSKLKFLNRNIRVFLHIFHIQRKTSQHICILMGSSSALQDMLTRNIVPWGYPVSL